MNMHDSEAPFMLRDSVMVWPQVRMVKRGDIEVHLPPQLFAILLAIGRAKFGITVQGLFNTIYSDRPDGGPATGRKSMCVQRVHLNDRIGPLRLFIKSPGSGHPNGLYELKVIA